MPAPPDVDPACVSAWEKDAVALYLMGSSSISVQARAAFAGQDTELATLPGLRAEALRDRHGIGSQLLIQWALTVVGTQSDTSVCTEIEEEPIYGSVTVSPIGSRKPATAPMPEHASAAAPSHENNARPFASDYGRNPRHLDSRAGARCLAWVRGLWTHERGAVSTTH
jgi:hypothetical protein